ncbi:hypothetical protein Goklo_007525 [Gossypium klotzschianum]|uniref:Uncharacterized protein n=1 Tax=Gossypium klotzschianum TaxID=34286 RepID=A0A7J8UX65_9ROSI|nr:hypothetical protein [Gossypium klotzschianum]
MEASPSHELPGKTLSAEEKDMLADSNRCIKDDSSRQGVFLSAGSSFSYMNVLNTRHPLNDQIVQLMTIDEEDFYQLQNPSNDAQLPNAEDINITYSMRRKESEINGPSPSSLKSLRKLQVTSLSQVGLPPLKTYRASIATNSSVATWLRLPKLPIEYFDMDILREIGRGTRPLLRVDSHTIAGERGRYNCLCVQLNLHKPLPRFVTLKDINKLFFYEGVDSLCFSCGKINHLIARHINCTLRREIA